MKIPFCILPALIGAIISVFPPALQNASAADTPRSVVLRNHSIERSPFRLQENRSGDEIWDAFMLVEKANSGDAPAMHELGLRYLMGKNFTADTVKAAYWIGLAAAKGLGTAQYNYAIFLNNGWGVPWNPFEAYRLVKSAASRGITEAEYMYGLFLAENLVVKSDLPAAYKWISMAADSGFLPAREVLNEFALRGLLSKVHGGDQAGSDKDMAGASSLSQNPALQPVILDVGEDTVPQPDDSVLIAEAVRAHTADSAEVRAVGRLQVLEKESAAGSPEASTLLGRFYEEGQGVPKNGILASLYYVRAVRSGSPWAPYLLWKIIHSDHRLYRDLIKYADAGDPAAAFVLSALADFGFDDQLTPSQALGLLVSSAARNYPDALVQLGLCYYSGRWVRQDRERALNLLHDAERLGSQEATVRLAAINLEDLSGSESSPALIDSLRSAVGKGSVLAEAVLGYCYETGHGIAQDTSKAVEWYRNAWQRGSRTAFAALRKMYDEIRPPGIDYQVTE